jgi:hypothetical protein
VMMDQWGNEGMDGYGNIVLDDSGHLFVSGQGSPPGTGGTDDVYLVAKHSTSDLTNVWRALTVPTGNVIASSEAWGGLSYEAGMDPGDGRLVSAGWYMGPGGAQGFIDVYTDLNAAAPTVAQQVTVAATGQRADWVLDNAIDTQGNIYAVGFSTGNLGGAPLGQGDAYIVKYSPTLTAPQFVKVGTNKADQFRKLVIDGNDRLYAIGYTYGNLAGANADATQQSGDLFMQKYDTDLNLLAETQLGTSYEERGYISLGNGRLYVGGMTEASLTGTNQGSYDAFLFALDTADLSVVDLSTGLADALTSNPAISLYPNPAALVLFIHGDVDADTGFVIHTLDGRSVMHVRSTDSRMVDVSGLGAGVYVLTARYNGNEIRSRFVKE